MRDASGRGHGGGSQDLSGSVTRMDAEVEVILRSSGVENELLTSIVWPYLTEIGVKTVHDLEFITNEDINTIDGILIIIIMSYYDFTVCPIT